MKEVWDEIWTLDNLGHLFLWLVIAGLIYFLPGYLSAPLIATLWLFNREKLQWNCKLDDWDFRLGWPWQEPKWSLHKQMEWIAPSVGGVILLLAMAGLKVL